VFNIVNQTSTLEDSLPSEAVTIAVLEYA